MKQQEPTGIDKLIYYRLIALWALCEALLGGIIHGFNIPVSGLIVGSCAVICICLIGYYVPAKGSILKATLIVAIFKMMLSPQAPPLAYLAVFFQGLMGEALFWNRKLYPLSCLLLGILAMLESGLQRIVVLTIVYGNDLWKAINNFINGITGQTTLTDYSFFIAVWYVLIHVIVGVLIGLWAGILPERIRLWTALHKEYLVPIDYKEEETLLPVKRKRKLRKGLIVIWVALLLLYVQSYYNIGPPLLPPHISIRIFIRSVLIVLTWYFLAGPFITLLLNKWLQKRKTRENAAIEKVLQLLPDTKQLVEKSWRLADTRKGGRRILLCCKIILLNIFHSNDS
jgi:hypothetical protein